MTACLDTFLQSDSWRLFLDHKWYLDSGAMYFYLLMWPLKLQPAWPGLSRLFFQRRTGELLLIDFPRCHYLTSVLKAEFYEAWTLVCGYSSKIYLFSALFLVVCFLNSS